MNRMSIMMLSALADAADGLLLEPEYIHLKPDFSGIMFSGARLTINSAWPGYLNMDGVHLANVPSVDDGYKSLMSSLMRQTVCLDIRLHTENGLRT